MLTTLLSATFNALKLLLPALFPSWRFFDVIGPSPRIEIALLRDPDEEQGHWREVRPRRDRLDAAGYLKSFFWNPRWNETLFLVTCAERLIQHPSDLSTNEIRDRIRADLHRADLHRDAAAGGWPYFRFRVAFMSRLEGDVRRDVVFVSPAYRTAGESPDGVAP
jgi:hypothetical protein